MFRSRFAEINGENDEYSDPKCTELPAGCTCVQIVEEVSGGCVCCTVRRDIEDVLAEEAMNPTPQFDLIVVDTTAASDPMPVIATLFEEHANEVVTPEVIRTARHANRLVLASVGGWVWACGRTYVRV